MRCAITFASFDQLSGAGLDPLQTATPLKTQQNANQAATNREPAVPTVPSVPAVPKASCGWVPIVPGSTIGSIEPGTPFRTMPIRTCGSPGTNGTAMLGTSGAM